jgi:predicted nucleic acid-binding protein
VILLDTNVVSALMRAEPEAAVVAWLDAQPAESMWLASITVFEIRFGLEIMIQGRRRRRLEEDFATAVAQDFEGRVLAFDGAAAESAATIAARQRRAGRPVEIRDVLIAGIVAARKATLATRNTRHFAGLGIALVDPWTGASSRA